MSDSAISPADGGGIHIACQDGAVVTLRHDDELTPPHNHDQPAALLRLLDLSADGSACFSRDLRGAAVRGGHPYADTPAVDTEGLASLSARLRAQLETGELLGVMGVHRAALRTDHMSRAHWFPWLPPACTILPEQALGPGTLGDYGALALVCPEQFAALPKELGPWDAPSWRQQHDQDVYRQVQWRAGNVLRMTVAGGDEDGMTAHIYHGEIAAVARRGGADLTFSEALDIDHLLWRVCCTYPRPPLYGPDEFCCSQHPRAPENTAIFAGTRPIELDGVTFPVPYWGSVEAPHGGAYLADIEFDGNRYLAHADARNIRRGGASIVAGDLTRAVRAARARAQDCWARPAETAADARYPSLTRAAPAQPVAAEPTAADLEMQL